MRPWTWRTDTAECRAGEFEPDKRKRQTAPAASIASLTQRLEGAARAALKRVLADASERKLQSALATFAEFAALCPEREPLFMDAKFQGDRQAALYNEWTMILWAEYVSIRISPKTKDVVKMSTLQEYGSMIKEHLSLQYGFDIAGSARRYKKLVKKLLRQDPRVSERKRRVGIRRRHLKKVWRKSAAWRVQTKAQVNRVASVTTAWQCLARGGEVTVTEKWDPTKHPSRADLTFGSRRGGRFAVVWLRPLKKRTARAAQKVPILIAEHDGSGSDAYAALKRMETLDPVAFDERSNVPLFRRGTGVAMTKADFVKACREVATACGIPAEDTGGHGPRIGGAIDLSEVTGSESLLKAKGRWASDIGRIYARMTKRAQMAASRAMQKGSSIEMEQLFPSFTQTAG